MRKTKRVTEISRSLQALKSTDIYSMLLFVLYKLKDDPKYITLSELAMTLDGANLTKLFAAFGGMTIKIPTLREFRLVTQALMLYQYTELDGQNISTALSLLAGDEFTTDEIKEAYSAMIEVLKEYDFGGSLVHAEE